MFLSPAPPVSMRATRISASLIAALVATGFPARVAALEIVKQSDSLTVSVDVARARPGGLLVVTVYGNRTLRSASAIFLGRRHALFAASGRLRALIPVPLGTPSGTTVLGVEVRQRRRKRRIPIDVTLNAVDYGRREILLSQAKRPLLSDSEATRDGRRILGLMRTMTPRAHWRGPFRPPVDKQPLSSFGMQESIEGGSPFNRLFDGLHDEIHRGLDYSVPSGTVVQAPAAGTVLFAGLLTASGQTIVIDHGQGILSVLFHLSRVEVREGQWIEGRSPIALSGESGLVSSPTLHWGVYVGGVAVDPRALFDSLE